LAKKQLLSFAHEVSLSYSHGSLTRRKTLRHGTDGFYFPSEESRATDFIVLKDPSTSVGFQTAKLGSNGKHDRN
jgi:hypothetical protein